MDNATKNSLEELKEKIFKVVSDKSYPHDPFVIISLQEAVTAAQEGNFGVGAVLVRNDKEIVERGHSHVFFPYFRSDLHAEMDVMTKFEDNHKQVTDMAGYTLFSSVEPCPMCLARLITSGVRKVFYATTDEEGGMVSRLTYMPSAWQELVARRQQFALAKCSPDLSEIARQVFQETVEKNNNSLKQR